MKIKFNKVELQNAMSVLSGIVPARSAKPILKNVLLSVDDGVKLIASDVDVTMSRFIEAQEISEPENACLPFAKLNNIIRDSSGDTVEFNIKSGKCKVKIGSGKFNLTCEEAKDFPEIKNIDVKKSIDIDGMKFQDSIKKSVFAAARNEDRFSLSGCFIDISDSKINTVCTDTFRLSVNSMNISNDSKVSCIVPLKGIQEIMKVCDTSESIINITDSHIFFENSICAISSRIIDANFPNYKNVIPKIDGIVKVNRDDLIRSIRQLSNVAHVETKAIDLTITNEHMTIDASGLDGADGTVNMDIESTVNTKVSLNYQYLLDALKVCDNDTVSINIKDETSPVIVNYDSGKCVISQIASN